MLSSDSKETASVWSLPASENDSGDPGVTGASVVVPPPLNENALATTGWDSVSVVSPPALFVIVARLPAPLTQSPGDHTPVVHHSLPAAVVMLRLKSDPHTFIDTRATSVPIPEAKTLYDILSIFMTILLSI